MPKSEEERRRDRQKKTLYNMGASVFDKEINKGAEKFAAFLSTFPFVNKDIVERLWGVGKSWIEQLKGDRSPLAIAGIEKFTDFLDFTQSHLFGHDKAKGESVVAKKAQDWMDDFMKDAAARIKEAKTEAAKRKVFELVKVEFQLRQELLRFIEEAQPKEAAKEKKPFLDEATKEKLTDFFKNLGTLEDPTKERLTKFFDNVGQKFTNAKERMKQDIERMKAEHNR